MKKLIIMLLLFVTVGLCAQVTDSTLQIWYDKYPPIRPVLEMELPEAFGAIEVDAVIFDFWKEYKKGEHYYLVCKADDNWLAVVDMNGKQGGYIGTSIKGDTVLVIGQSVNGNVPAHLQEIIDKLNE